MTRATRNSTRDDGMGQSSSQHAQLSEGAGGPENNGECREMQTSAKRRKKKIIVSEQPLEPERGIAEALVQMAQGGLKEAGIAHAEIPESRKKVPKRYMTSQERIDKEVKKRKTERHLKRKRKKQKKDEVSNALAELDVEGNPRLESKEPTPSAHRNPSPNGHHEQQDGHTSLHPLDNVSTDGEVEELEKGMQNGNGTPDPLTWEEGQSRSDVSAGGDQLLLPTYSASQRMRATDEIPREDPGPRQKRKRANGTSTDTGQGHTQQDMTPDTQQLALTSFDNDLEDAQRSPRDALQPPANVSLLNPESEDGDMPIDPDLETLFVRQAGPEEPSPDFNHQEASQPATKIRKKPRKRSKVNLSSKDDPYLGKLEDEKPYVSPYTPMEKSNKSHVQASANDLPKADGNELEILGTNDQITCAPQRSGKANNQNKFGHVEFTKMERFRDDWCRRNQKQHQHFNDLIQSNIRGNPRAVLVYKELQEMFPNHQASYIQRFCRRKFHNFSARGTWSPEQDDELREAVAEKGTAWKLIGEVVHRFPEDCRDRWRNYLVNTDQRTREYWTDAEILNMARAILDCWQIARPDQLYQEAENVDPTLTPLEPYIDLEAIDMKLVNWQAVSERMGKHGGARSRLQCSFKWSHLKAADQARFLMEALSTRRSGKSLLNHPSGRNTVASGGRAARAKKKTKNMLAGDKVDLLHAIVDSAASSEGNIPWSFIGTQRFQDKWTKTERKAAWLMMKESLEIPEGEDYRQTINKLLQEIPEAEREQRQAFTNDAARHQKQSRQSTAKRKGGRDGYHAEQQQEEPQSQSQAPYFSHDRTAHMYGNEAPNAADNSDIEGDGEYRPGSDQIEVGEDFAGLDPLLSTGPKTRGQRAALDETTHDENGVNGNVQEEYDHDSLFDEPLDDEPAGTSMEDGDVNANLGSRDLGLADA